MVWRVEVKSFSMSLPWRLARLSTRAIAVGSVRLDVGVLPQLFVASEVDGSSGLVYATHVQHHAPPLGESSRPLGEWSIASAAMGGVDNDGRRASEDSARA